MALTTKIAEGKTKIVRSSSNPDEVILEFKDSITAFDGEKMDRLPEKGKINAALTNRLFSLLNKNGVRTHLIELTQPGVMRARKLIMIPLEVVCRNLAAGHFLKRFPMYKRGERLKIPVVEFYLKNDELHDPMLVDDHILLLGLAAQSEIEEMKRLTKRANEVLSDYMKKRGLLLADFKIEFGRDKDGNLVIGDELSADSMRLWDVQTGKIFDKDVYREGKSLGDVARIYEEGLLRIVGEG